MAIFKTLLSLSIATLAAAAPSLSARQTSSIVPLFCTDAVYPGGDPYAEPYGGGYCAGLTADLGSCYSWSSFPSSETGQLVNNLTYVFIPGTYVCKLYKDCDCEGTPYEAQDGDNDLSNTEFGPLGYNDAVNSFLCVSS